MPTPVESFAASLNADEQKLLHASVAFALRVTAKADNVVDGKEEKTIAGLAGRIREQLGEAFAGAPDSYPDAMKAAAHPDWTQGQYVNQLLEILRRMPEEARKLYDHVVLELALSVAGASGGILGFGEKVSVEERYALRRLVGTLRLTVHDPVLKKTLGYD